MKRVCCSCNQILGEVDGPEHGSTHTFCPSCLRSFVSGCKTHMQTFLNTFEEPILLVNDEGRVITANQAARELLNKDFSEIEGYLGGEVMECAYSCLEGGCGNTIHCKSCTIRNLVMRTHETGQSYLNQIAHQDIKVNDETQQMKFLISTEKLSESVMLKVEVIIEN